MKESHFINNQLKNYYGDYRLLELLKYNKNGDFKCIYCYKKANTREHIPSKIFLDEPYPKTLALLPSCFKCNNSFSKDEQYVACLIDYIQYIQYELQDVKREKIRKAFNTRPNIKQEMENTIVDSKDKKSKYIKYNHEKIESILLKLSIGHATYSLSRVHLEKPSGIYYKFLPEVTEEEFNNFNAEVICDIAPEIGSRSFNNIALTDDSIPMTLWNIVQENQYRFLAYENKSGLYVRIVIGEFLYSEVIWNN